MEDAYSSKRILKNTLFLYLRQIVALVVSLYTSRVTLDVLGIDDYGLYNVIAGIVVILALVNSSMVSATQRFLTYEIGRGDKKQVSNTFSMSMTAHLLICLLVFIVGETVGLNYIKEYLVIPKGRYNATLWVYQLSLLSIYTSVVRSPYQASIISYEKLDFFAIISIAEVIIKLLIVYTLLVIDFDKLILYTILLLVSNILVTIGYRAYCIHHFDTCRYVFYMDKSYFRKLSGYLGWNVAGAFATMGTQQAGNLIINHFVGVAVNAAYGIANSVSAALGSFLSSFQMAFQPQIVKLYAQNDKDRMFTLMNRTAKLSYFLVFIIIAPLLFYIDYVLGIWLKEIPTSTGVFCNWLFVTSFLNAVQCPLWISISATGNIKMYQIWQSLLWLISIPMIYICLSKGLPAYWVVIVRFIIAVLCTIGLLTHVHIQINFPIINCFKNVFSKIFIVSSIYIFPLLYLRQMVDIQNFIMFVLYYLSSVFYIAFLVYVFGVDSIERNYIKNFIKNRIGCI